MPPPRIDYPAHRAKELTTPFRRRQGYNHTLSSQLRSPERCNARGTSPKGEEPSQ